MSTLFTDEQPKPFGEYPPNDAYYVILLLGLIPGACLILAPVFAYKYPGVGWKWGLWACAPLVLALILVSRELLTTLFGVVVVVLNPLMWGVIVLCCVFAFAAARVKMGKAQP